MDNYTKRKVMRRIEGIILERQHKEYTHIAVVVTFIQLHWNCLLLLHQPKSQWDQIQEGGGQMDNVWFIPQQHLLNTQCNHSTPDILEVKTEVKIEVIYQLISVHDWTDVLGQSYCIFSIGRSLAICNNVAAIPTNDRPTSNTHFKL